MKILAFAASSSRKSINKQLVTHAASVLKSEILSYAEIEIIDLNDFEMSLYSIDREEENGIPDPAHQFFKKIGEADALLISFAEHNGFYTAAYKNLFDWTSRIEMKIYQSKPMVILATSPGRSGGEHVLQVARDSAPFFGAEIKASLAIPSFNHNFDTETEQLNNFELEADLKLALATLSDLIPAVNNDDPS